MPDTITPPPVTPRVETPPGVEAVQLPLVEGNVTVTHDNASVRGLV